MKYLTDEDVRFKGKEHYINLKKRFNLPDINHWYQEIYRHPRSIGYVCDFFREQDPKTVEQAYDMYTLSGILDVDKKPLEHRGRSTNELEDMAIDWREKSGVDLPLVDFYDALVLHAVVETCFGIIMERRAEDAYRARGFTTKETDGYLDRKCGIDFIAQKEDKTILVQVKPATFFRGDGLKTGLADDRKTMRNVKQKEGLSKFPDASYAFMMYEQDESWVKKGNRFNFRYDDLVNEDGTMKVNIDSTEYTREKKLY